MDHQLELLVRLGVHLADLAELEPEDVQLLLVAHVAVFVLIVEEMRVLEHDLEHMAPARSHATSQDTQLPHPVLARTRSVTRDMSPCGCKVLPDATPF